MIASRPLRVAMLFVVVHGTAPSDKREASASGERVEIDHAGTGIFEDLAFAVACDARSPTASTAATSAITALM